ncbi:MAG: hypothetical protein U0640_15530 [Phycisphaerales bacterium]
MNAGSAWITTVVYTRIRTVSDLVIARLPDGNCPTYYIVFVVEDISRPVGLNAILRVFRCAKVTPGDTPTQSVSITFVRIRTLWLQNFNILINLAQKCTPGLLLLLAPTRLSQRRVSRVIACSTFVHNHMPRVIPQAPDAALDTDHVSRYHALLNNTLNGQQALIKFASKRRIRSVRAKHQARNETAAAAHWCAIYK